MGQKKKRGEVTSFGIDTILMLIIFCLQKIENPVVDTEIQFEGVVKEWSKTGSTKWIVLRHVLDGQISIDIECYVIGLQHPALSGVVIPSWLAQSISEGK